MKKEKKRVFLPKKSLGEKINTSSKKLGFTLNKKAKIEFLQIKGSKKGNPILFCSDFKKYSKNDCLEIWEKMNDSELAAFVLNENREAYEILFKRYQRKIFVYVYHLIGSVEETEDVVQNVFVKTYKNIQHFDLDKKFSSWLYRIAHNEAVNFLKRKSRKNFVSFEDALLSKDKMDLSVTDELLEDKILRQEHNEEIQNALKILPKRYTEVLQMRYFSEYSYEKIGKILGLPINTVGTLISRAKRKLLEVVKKGSSI